MSRADLAVAYATRGWWPFPCEVGGKAPGTRSGCKAATDDLVTIRQRWRKTDWNIGITAGPSNLVIIDLDVKPENGPAGLGTFHGLGGDSDATYCVVTPRGGLHAYYTVADGFWYPPSAGRVAPNIDVRAGWSYVLAAGSVVDGIEYEECGAAEPMPLPDWLGALIDRPPPDFERVERKHQADVRAGDDGRMKAWRGIRDHFEQRAQANVDRNTYFYWAVRAVGDHLWPIEFKDACVEELKDVGLGMGLTESEVTASSASARRRWP